VKPTSLTVDQDTLKRLREYRTDEHYTWDEALNDLLHTVPPTEKLREGCEHCGEPVLRNKRRSDSHMVVQSFTAEGRGESFHLTRLFCSLDCAGQSHEKMEAMVPENPDEIIVGGADAFRTSFEGASYYVDGETREVGIPLPGAFDGEGAHGEEYDYIGEPVYIHNDGRVVQNGVIKDIIHEDAYTALLLNHDYETVMNHHPNEDKQVEWAEKGPDES